MGTQDRFTHKNSITFEMLSFLDKYLEGHKGFVAGGCFKNIFSGERVKDIDIFFECQQDFLDAVELYRSKVASGEWTVRYENSKAIAFQEKGSKIWVELIKSVFGTPKGVLRMFDFTVTKFAYVRSLKLHNLDLSGYVVYHEDFFTHLHLKRLVIDDNIPFPISTWERSYRYKGYGFNLCRESKQKLLDAIRKTTKADNELSMYNLGGWD